MTNIEKYKVLSQPYISSKDVMRITGICYSSASTLAAKIRWRLKNQGIKFLDIRGHIPTKYLLEEMGIDINEIYENAMKEKALGIGE